jgi:eukaryotic translation initiation factor 2C
MADIKFHTGSNIGTWTYIWFKSTRTRDYYQAADVHQTVMNFQSFLIRSGVNASGFIREQQPPIIELQDGQEGANDEKIKAIFRGMFAAKTRPRFVLCILPHNDVAIYNSIKTVADTKAGIHTVCVVGQKFMKDGPRQLQYFGNVSLKFNLKAGGTNQTIDASKLGVVGERKTMVVGIDVTHPSPGSKDGAPSVAGVVASRDSLLGQWPATWSIQESRKEMVTALEGMFLSRLKLWEKTNKSLPENIVIYRDGVSEGQYQQLLDDELPQIRNACRQAYPADATKKNSPKISVIVCGKRHHTRFYPVQENEADRSSNCGPGTVVDRGVTEVAMWDFFIQPHACLQGTARPAHYVVVLDEVFRGRQPKGLLQNAADSLEELTHNMCHLFGRATKAVSLCPPAYYADLLCTRLRCYLSDQFDPNDSSATPSVASSAAAPIFDINIPENLRDSMYYI